MRRKIYFWLCVAALCGVVAFALYGTDPKATCAAALIALAAFILHYRATSKPMKAIRSGMDLLRSQDFASRLRPVGQKDADEVVRLFNTIMESMKSERLKNQEQNAFLGKLVEASPMGVAICSFDGEIESTNPAFLRLASPAVIDALRTLGDGEERTLRPDSGQVLRCSRMFFMDRGFRRPFYLVERLTDEIVRAETEMFHKIVRTMGHEVNNTLGGVISVIESLAQIHADDEVISEVLASCEDSCHALSNFVRSYSDVVKLPDPILEPLDLGDFARSTEAFLAHMCPEGISLRVITDNAATVSADSQLINRVIVNAVKNAVESIGAGPGNITVTARGRSLEIADNGPGLSPEAAARVFTPFFSTKNADRGLGLMLISEILRKHRAAFSLSTDPDGLTRLKISF